MGRNIGKNDREYWISEEGLKQIEEWASNGLNNSEIAENIGIGYRTFYDWMTRYPQISQRLKGAKELAVQKVENALYKSALGYDYEEVTEELRFDKSIGDYVMKVTKRVKKHAQPSYTAQIFILKNKMSSEYHDVYKQEVSVDNDDTIKEMNEYFRQHNQENADPGADIPESV